MSIKSITTSPQTPSIKFHEANQNSPSSNRRGAKLPTHQIRFHNAPRKAKSKLSATSHKAAVTTKLAQEKLENLNCSRLSPPKPIAGQVTADLNQVPFQIITTSSMEKRLRASNPTQPRPSHEPVTIHYRKSKK